MSLDRNYIVNSASACLLEIEEQGDDRNHYDFHPSELDTFQYADEIYLKLYQNQEWLLTFLRHNFDHINQQADSSEIETHLFLNDQLLSMAIYFVVVRAVGKKISKLKNPDNHKCFYKKTAELILRSETISFSDEVLCLLKSLIMQKLSKECERITPEIMVYCVVFFAANSNEEENIELLKRLNKAFGPTLEDLYLMYRVAYHRTHSTMDIVDFFGRFALLQFFDMAIPYTGEQFLSEKIPTILTNRLRLKLSIAERLELFMFLQHPRSNSCAELIWEFFHSTEPAIVAEHIQIFRSFYDLVERGENVEFVNLCNMMVFLYSCRNSYTEIISSLSSEEKGCLKNECEKYLASIRSLDTKALNQIDFDYHIVCSFMTACFLRDTVSLWAAIKPLLLALRVSKKVWVLENLKVMAASLYHEKNLASIILLLFDTKDEFVIKKELKRLRCEMADGLMELLKPLPDKKYKPDRVKNYSTAAKEREGFDPRCTEPDPLYRQGYINAFSELCIKSDDTGHTFFAELNRLASKDPSSKVQSAAKEAVRKLNNMSLSGDDYAQKAYIKTALWHIFKAHIFEHEAAYDEDAALETKAGLSLIF
jgi:hypothetical protein